MYSQQVNTFELTVDVFLVIACGILVFVVIPSYLYLNGLIVLFHLFVHHYNEIIAVLPDITGNDFVTLCVEGSPVNKAQVPSMNGHVIVAGELKGQNYVCLNIRELISQLNVSDFSKQGLNATKNIVKIPDGFCSGVEPSQFPKGK